MTEAEVRAIQGRGHKPRDVGGFQKGKGVPGVSRRNMGPETPEFNSLRPILSF